METQNRKYLHSGFKFVALISIFLCGLIVRNTYINILGGGDEYFDWALSYFFGGISPGYLQGADTILNNHIYLSIAYPPGYSIYIAFIKLIGFTSIQSLRVSQAIVDLSSIIPLFIIMGYLGVNNIYRLFAVTLYAVSINWSLGSTFILAEWISPSIILWSLLLFIKAYQFEKIKSYVIWCFLGILVGIGAMFRPDLVLMIVPFGFSIFCKKVNNVKKITAIICLFCGFMSIMGSWGAYNKIYHGHWVMTTTGGGGALWEGLGEVKNNYGYVLNDVAAGEEVNRHGFGWLTPEGNKWLTHKYIQAWQQHPLFVCKTILHRWKQIIFSARYDVYYIRDSLSKLSILFNYLGMLCFGVFCYKNYKNPIKIFLVGFPLFYALMSIGLTHYEPRYVRYVPLTYLMSFIWCLNYLNDNISLYFKNQYMKNIIKYFQFTILTILAIGILLKINSYSMLGHKEINPANINHKVASLDDLHWKYKNSNNESVNLNSKTNLELTETINTIYSKATTRSSLVVKLKYNLLCSNCSATLGVYSRNKLKEFAHIDLQGSKAYSGVIVARTNIDGSITIKISSNDRSSNSKILFKALDVYTI